MTEQKYNALYLSEGTNFLNEVIKTRDEITYDHSRKVAGISLEIGALCGFSREELNLLNLSALFHDIGNIAIPDSILKKTRKIK